MNDRKAPYWETPLDLFKLLLTAAAIWAIMGPLGAWPGMGISADLSESSLSDAAVDGAGAADADDDTDADAADTDADVAADTDAADSDTDAEAADTDTDTDTDADADNDADKVRDADAADADTSETTADTAATTADANAPAIVGNEQQLAPGDTIEGRAAPGARLMCYDGETPLGEFLADADGNWIFTLPEALDTDTLTLRVVEVNADGEELGEVSRSLRILPAGLPKTGRAALGR